MTSPAQDLHAVVPRPSATASSGADGEAMDVALRAFQQLQIRTAHVSSLVATTIGITPTDVRALLFIASEDGVTPKRMGEILEVTSGAITNVVDRMVAADLVQRAPHPSDRRSLILALAPHGITTVDRIIDLYRRAFTESIPAHDLPLLADTFTVIGASLVETATRDAAHLQPLDPRATPGDDRP